MLLILYFEYGWEAIGFADMCIFLDPFIIFLGETSVKKKLIEIKTLLSSQIGLHTRLGKNMFFFLINKNCFQKIVERSHFKYLKS